ncbi:disintegrin and metalloproteinase domain-containing protein 8 isoform X2 [Phyllostomus discolor]|uniref:Disintegrin and metalloproteinase domain-containing protein 8 isoform X2 n=1 Tax=Phyllostomus discolor TaxID=89673 RepID=A0A6J2LPL8_9CHIR|nr:disintegrin and metalloproteinase domain-containing protein 8 isoform X2 [Phyllostomus discolor]
MPPVPRVPALTRAMCRRGLWLLGALWLQVVAPSAPLPHVEQYEVVWPQRLPGSRTRRAPPSGLGLHPESVSYVLRTRGRNVTLHLQKNRDLVASSYTETYTAANGSQVTQPLQGQDHCFYQGHVEGQPHSAASLSTCDGLRGFFRVGSDVHLIEPLPGGGEEGQHALYEPQHLRQEAGTCGVSNTSLDSLLSLRTSAAFRPRNGPRSQEIRYVELYMVTDSAEFRRLGSTAAVRRRVLEVVNHVDKLYQGLGFRVVLVGLEMWTGKDEIEVSSNAETTLDNFLAWRTQRLVGRHAHDNAQLITGIDFNGNTVGLAKVSTMCSRHSGAVNQDHTKDPIGVACTMAHEMGHNLGMNHDEKVPGCYCPSPPRDGKCVMAASIGFPYPKVFSQCSRADLQTFMENLPKTCLANQPDLDRLVGGPVCGNGFVERGEQCDCGQPQDCQNRCCNATTCRLVHGAECAHGACCHECKVKPAGELCRPRKDACDLEEHCDGRQPACPEDAFQENGTACEGGYCSGGVCPTRPQQCRDLWGPGSRAAVEQCYAYSLLPGCRSGGPVGSAGAPCGILFCEGGQVPRGRSSCTISNTCQALSLEGSPEYERVLDGTKCGHQRVCWGGLCQDLHVYRTRNCSAQCSGRGVCNHKGKCHCRPGWAPPRCAEPVAEARTAPESLLVPVLVPMLLLLALGLALAAVVAYRKAGSRIRRRNMAPKTTMGLSNPLFYQGASRPAKGTATAAPVGPPELVPTTRTAPSQPSRPTASAVTSKRPPPAPPATMSSPPFPVPVYTQQSPAQLRPAPPSKPLPELKPRQAVRPTCTPPVPPVKPQAQRANPGPTEGAVGPKVALQPPAQRR